MFVGLGIEGDTYRYRIAATNACHQRQMNIGTVLSILEK